MKNKDVKLDVAEFVDDEYLAEALSLHQKTVDLKTSAKSPNLFFKRLSVIAACLLIAVAILPLSFVLSATLGEGCGSGGFAPSLNDSSDGTDKENMTDDSLSGEIHSVGDSWQTEAGAITYLSLEGDSLTLIVKLTAPEELGLIITGISDAEYYYSNYSTEDTDMTYVDNSVSITVNSTEDDGTQRITLDLSGFKAATGLGMSELTLTLRGFGSLKLTQ